LYIGLNGGFANYNSEVDFGEVAGFDGEHPNGNQKSSKNGGLIGGQIGYNWQIRKLVLGIEGDGDFLFGLSKMTHGGYLDAVPGATLTSDATGFASVRGRVGFDVFDGTLLYGTAGVGWLKINNNWTVDRLSGGLPKGGNFRASKWQPAFVAGAGFETMIDPRWSVRGEVLWVLPENINVGPTDTHYFFSRTTGSPVVSHSTDVLFARVGVNYKIW
jgi:outer membrane immunogenic protein